MPLRRRKLSEPNPAITRLGNPHVGGRPVLDGRHLVRDVVVQDQMDLMAGRYFTVEFGQELLELHRAVPAVQ